MTVSTILQSKISKTKKKLSSADWNLSIIVLSVMALFAIMAFAFRAVTLPAAYSLIEVSIPVLSVPIDDPSFHNFRETPRRQLNAATPAVFLTVDAFYFGDIASFTTGFGEIRNKFMIKHVDGSPQMAKLVQDMKAWQEERSLNNNIHPERTVVFVPTGEIPAPIVIQVVAALKRSSLFDQVVIGSGLM
jgi:hypothetical protein